ncbi:MAG: hypothetical protein A2W90_20330 [Bacteroidetes bacterium GWF2_42_66]|nr:MAG: hypothetical protein A2W92_12700 [Bacteroidetes bacterium GWA2_42_15]OFX98460.1 MAG: hypothetical protein A2W89_08695 [Bacteroidetes bacterium GWE2_42_39]OFY42845.1 MAG: hypothetical protein A2W90_20330 [Bacteroidetes bacterium GWF2_42_66]HBL74473.1 hypothetical protein [Prolixibacteraceae bacterium]HCR90860.1 hypothetical protein [Prolixibacteraceae bacterium]
MEELGNRKKRFSLGETEKERKNNLIIIFLSVILVTVVVIFIVQRIENQRIVTAINIEKQAIQEELNGMVAGYDSLKTTNDTLSQELFVAQTKVKDLLLEVGQVKKASYEQIESYRQEVTSLRSIMQNFVVQIDSLNKRNEMLMKENMQVKQEFAQIEGQKEQLEKEKQQLQEKVSRAAMLEARNLFATGINQRGKDENSVRRAEQIKISFTLSSNVTTKRGEKTIYVRIQRPDQVLLTKSKTDLFPFEDLNIPFSASRTVTYEGEELPVNIFWDNTNQPMFQIGEYTIDVFVDGFNVGTTTVEFKR